MRLSETQDERVFGWILRVEGIPEAAEHFLIFVLIFLGHDHKRSHSEAVFGPRLPTLF